VDEERLTDLESKVSQLQSKIASLPTGNTDTTRLEGDIDSMWEEIAELSEDISTRQAEINSLQAEVDSLQASVTALQETQSSESQTSSGDAASSDDIQVSISQPYTAYVIPELDIDESYTVPFMMSITLENTATVNAKDIMVMLSMYPQATRTGYTITPAIAGGILFTQYSANSFQSWGAISLNSGQKKTYQLSVNILLENKTGAKIDSGALTIPVQAYCIDASF